MRAIGNEETTEVVVATPKGLKTETEALIHEYFQKIGPKTSSPS